MGENTHSRALDALHDELAQVAKLLTTEHCLSVESGPRVVGLVDRFELFVGRVFGVLIPADAKVGCRTFWSLGL